MNGFIIGWRSWLGTWILVSSVLIAGGARADQRSRVNDLAEGAEHSPRFVDDEGKGEMCRRWLGRARDLVREGRLLEARAVFPECTAPSCGEVRTTCLDEEARAKQATPELTVVVKTEDGESLSSAQVRIGTLTTRPALPVELDPGQHSIVIDDPMFVGSTASVHLRPGERLVLPVTLRPHSTVRLRDAEPHQQASHWPMQEGALLLTAAGVGAIAGALVIDNYAREGTEEMKACAPYCEEVLEQKIERRVFWARSAAGLGFLSLTTAAWMALAKGPEDALPNRRWEAPKLRVTGDREEVRAVLEGRFDEFELFSPVQQLVTHGRSERIDLARRSRRTIAELEAASIEAHQNQKASTRPRYGEGTIDEQAEPVARMSRAQTQPGDGEHAESQ